MYTRVHASLRKEQCRQKGLESRSQWLLDDVTFCIFNALQRPHVSQISTFSALLKPIGNLRMMGKQTPGGVRSLLTVEQGVNKFSQ